MGCKPSNKDLDRAGKIIRNTRRGCDNYAGTNFSNKDTFVNWGNKGQEPCINWKSRGDDTDHRIKGIRSGKYYPHR